MLTFLTDNYHLPAAEYSIIDRQRIGWIFYLIEQASIQLDLRSIFIRIARILQPWFAEPFSQMVVRMSDDMNGTRQALISEQKRDTLLRIISMFANPYETNNEQQLTSLSALEIFPRNELNKKALSMFQKRRTFNDHRSRKRNYLLSFRCTISRSSTGSTQ